MQMYRVLKTKRVPSLRSENEGGEGTDGWFDCYTLPINRHVWLGYLLTRTTYPFHCRIFLVRYGNKLGCILLMYIPILT